jgi:hypothetical protein
VPTSLALTRAGKTEALLEAGAVIKPSFCGPCFGAGDVPANNGLSLRHTTRNFPNREGSKPGEGQISAVALMDSRSIAATAKNGGYITAATDIDYDYTPHEYNFDSSVYKKRVYYGFGKADPDAELLAARLASPVWEIYGKRGLLMEDETPILNKPYQDGSIAFHVKEGDHSQTMFDWEQIVRYFDAIIEKEKK